MKLTENLLWAVVLLLLFSAKNLMGCHRESTVETYPMTYEVEETGEETTTSILYVISTMSTEPETIEPYYTVEETTTVSETTIEETTIIETTFEETTTQETTTTQEETTTLPTIIETVQETTQYTLYSSDEILLLKVASCEAGGQGIIGLALVMRVVLNRAYLSNCSIESVIYAPNQFSCVGNHLWNNNYIVPDAYSALDLIKNGWDESCGARYFCSTRVYNPNGWFGTLQHVLTYGDHMFFK